MRFFRLLFASFVDVFNFRDDKAKGRVIALISSLLTTFYNVFITGIFYTGFLSMYGMSISDTGILSFVPTIATLATVFSPMILGRFKKRKKILLSTKIIFYFLYIIVTTLMPQFVKDPRQRLICFSVILLVAHGFYSLFNTGFTTWFYNFYPEENDKRTRYMTFSQIAASIMSSVVLLSSSLITDALSNSDFQYQLILGFRYFSFVLVIFDVLIQSKAEEYPYLENAKIKLTDIFTIPFKHKKFISCMLLLFSWSIVANMTGGLWNYHLLNHMDFSYTLINIMSVAYTIILMLLAPFWQKVLRRFSWIKTFGITILLWMPTEFLFFFMTPERAFMYVPITILQHIVGVGLNISSANILYMNLPAENSTACITFHNIGWNICAFIGQFVGTYISAITGDDTMYMLGMDIYSVQFIVVARGVMMILIGTVLVSKWRVFTKDQDIADIEMQDRMRARQREMRGGWRFVLYRIRYVISQKLHKG